MSSINASLKKIIALRVQKLGEEFTLWNNFLNKAEQMFPCKNSDKVILAFEFFFEENCIHDLKIQKSFIIKMMDVYGNNYLADLYGHDPLEECSVENIAAYTTAAKLVQSYIGTFQSLNNDSTLLLLKAIKRDLKYATELNKYFSEYFVNGRYVVNADLHKKELVDLCHSYQSKKTKVYDSLERLWAVIYQKKAAKNGTNFKSANGRAKKQKEPNGFVWVKNLERYSD